MAKIGFPKGSGKLLKVREKSVKSQGILKWILSGNPANSSRKKLNFNVIRNVYTQRGQYLVHAQQALMHAWHAD